MKCCNSGCDLLLALTFLTTSAAKEWSGLRPPVDAATNLEIGGHVERQSPRPEVKLLSDWPAAAKKKAEEEEADAKKELTAPANWKADPETEKDIEEVEDEAEEYEQYEKRKWIRIFESRSFFDWAVFFSFVLLFLVTYHRFLVGLPTATGFHGLAIVMWVGLGMLYNTFMYVKFGSEDATVWLNGYLLEIIFSLENVFVFHVIIESFGITTVAAQKCLFLVVCFQVVFELVLYMGLADVIDCLGFLPYVLGVWLLYLGLHVACESQDHSDFDILETCTVRTFRAILGTRLDVTGFAETPLSPGNSFDNTAIFSYRSEGYKMTLLGLVFICLLGADFILEIDVTLTKMEQTHDEYLSFTSSALAGFAVPELFFVARDLFRNFQLLKYGISFVLCFYGTDMLFPNLFTLSPIEGCGLILAIMLLCIVLSILGSAIYKEDLTPLEGDLAKQDYGTENDLPRRSQSRFSFVFEGPYFSRQQRL